MFDIQTEAYLRRHHPSDNTNGGIPIIPVTIVLNLLLWTTVLVTAL